MRSRIAVALLVCAMVNPAHAARAWIEGVTVKDILYIYNGGTLMLTVDFDSPVAPSTGCAPTDTHEIASWWTGGDVTNSAKMWLSMLLSAQAQGVTVDLFIEDSNCNTHSNWDAFGTPVGAGIRIEGVRINRQ